MSKISLKPNASGTGVFSLEAPNSNTDRTLNLPDEAGTLATVENLPAGYTDSDALDLFNVTGSAPVYACRAWVNFDGTGTVSLRDSGNVSSITDTGVGEYTVNFATNLPSANYVATGSTENILTDVTPQMFDVRQGGTKSISACQIVTNKTRDTGTADKAYIGVVFFG